MHPCISVSFSGDVAIIARRDAKRIAHHLTYPEVIHGERRGVIQGEMPRATLGRYDGDTFRFPAKLLVHVMNVMAQEGIAIEHSGCKFFRHEPDTEALGAIRDPIRSVMAHPSSHFGGVIPIIPEARPERVIPDLLKLYPRSRAVVAVCSNREVSVWETRLAAAGLRQEVTNIRKLSRGVWLGTPKVLVTTYHWLDRCRRDDFNLVIVPDAAALRDNDRWADVAWLDPVPRD